MVLYFPIKRQIPLPVDSARRHPNALWVRVFSFIPLFTPVTMLRRLASSTIPWWEIAATLLILLLFVVFLIYPGARIFSRGILQFDRNLSFKEIRRMLKKDYQYIYTEPPRGGCGAAQCCFN